MGETWIGVTGFYATDNPHPGLAVIRALREADPSWRIVALPYDPARDLVVLVEQFRTGCVDHPGDPWLIEAVAGLVEDGEAPEAVARREVREETGLEAGRLAYLSGRMPRREVAVPSSPTRGMLE